VPHLVGNAAINAFEAGDWDQALSQLTRALETGAVGEGARMQLEHFEVEFAIQRGEDTAETVARIDRYLGQRIDAGEQSFRSSRHFLAAAVDQGAGRYADAWDQWMLAATVDAFNAGPSYGWAILLAALLRDERRARSAMDGLRSTGSHAPVTKLWLSIGEATLDALAGRDRESLAGFRECLATAQALGLVWSRAQLGTAMAGLLDPALPDVRAAVDDARATYERLGARPWLERTDAILAVDPASGRRPDRPVARIPEPQTQTQG